MPIRIFKQITFLTSLILLAILFAGAITYVITYKEGGIFDSGFKQKMQLSEMNLSSEEVLDGLPSVTVKMIPEPGTPGENVPDNILFEAGKNISKASQEVSTSQIVNVDFSTKDTSESAEVSIHFRFNASTTVDYNDEVYDDSVRLLLALIASEKFSKVSVVSTPTPDGGRSLEVETTMRGTFESNTPSEFSNSWSETLRPLARFIGKEGNLSTAKLNSYYSSVSADFFNIETYDNAMNMDPKVFSAVDTVVNSNVASSVDEANFHLSAVSSEDSTLTVKLKSAVEESAFPAVSDSIFSALRRNNFTVAPWTVLVVVDKNPLLSSVVFINNTI